MTDDGIMEPEYHMHSYLFNHSYRELRFQMAGCCYISLGGQESHLLGEDASMNKYVVWIFHQSTEIYYHWFLFWSSKHAKSASACAFELVHQINICLGDL